MLSGIFVTIFLPFLYFYSESRAVYGLQVFVLGFTALQLVFSRPKNKMALSGLNKALLALLLGWFFTIVRSYYTAITPESTYPNILKLGGLLLLIFVVVSELAKDYKKSKNSFLAFGAIAGAIHGLIALLEYIEAPPIPATWLDPAAQEIFRTRCAGVFTDPNIFGSFLSVLFVLTLGALVAAPTRPLRGAVFLSALLSGFGILSTLSRGAWLALGAGLLVACFFIYFKPKGFVSIQSKKCLWALALCLALVVIIGPFKYRIISMSKPTDMTFAQRTLINKAFIKHYKDFPLTGFGLHSFNQVYPRYRVVGGDYPMNAHNEFLHSFLETGHLSALFLAFICAFIFKVFLSVREKSSLGSVIFPSLFAMLLVQNLSGFSARILPTAVFIAVAVAYAFYSNLAYKKNVITVGGKLKSATLAILLGFIGFLCTQVFATQMGLEKAVNFLRDGDLHRGKLTLEELYRRNPKNSLLASTLASLNGTIGNQKEAIKLYEEAVKLNPSEASFYDALAKLNYNESLNMSIDNYLKALELDPASENYRLALAKIYLQMGQQEKAQEVLETGLTYSPGFHEVYRGFLEMEELLETIKAQE